MNATLRFSALDSLFFRDARPFEALGGMELGGLFPPPLRTMAGAARGWLGDSAGVQWDQPESYRDWLGDADRFTPLGFDGPWPVWQGQRLYPAPAWLLRGPEGFVRLQPGSARECDLGRVRLPETAQRGVRHCEGLWFEPSITAALWAGQLPDTKAGTPQSEFAHTETRVGLALDHGRRTAQDGALYQTQHIRPAEGFALELDTTGLPAHTPAGGWVRLGGEGRVAQVQRLPATVLPPSPIPRGAAQGLILTLLTPVLDAGDALPPGFLRVSHADGHNVWRGQVQGIALTIHSAAIGKPLRLGGWDVRRNRPRPVQGYLPAGSGWYCTVDDGHLAEAIIALHGQWLCPQHELGRGRLACALWI